MIVTSITMSVVETAEFMNDPKPLTHQAEGPLLVVKNIFMTRDNIKAKTETKSEKEKIFSYNTLRRCWNYVTQDQ
jgi:hypothetical protein